MTRTRFHQGLEELKHKLLAMGGMAEKAVDTAVDAYRRRDLKLCQQVGRSFDCAGGINGKRIAAILFPLDDAPIGQ